MIEKLETSATYDYNNWNVFCCPIAAAYFNFYEMTNVIKKKTVLKRCSTPILLISLSAEEKNIKENIQTKLLR